MLTSLVQIYEKKYKILLTITLVLLIFFAGVLVFNKIHTGEFIKKDVSLKGGLLITIHSDKELDISATEKALSKELGGSVSVRKLQAVGSAAALGYSFNIEKTEAADAALDAISKVAGVELTEGAYTIEEVSSSFGATFWQSTIKAIFIAFILMTIVVFIYFRLPIPSLAVILCGSSDTVGTLAVMNLIGMPLSVGGVAALLMLIGYSVDTDILLSTRMLKRAETPVSERVKSSIKTGLTMQATAISALAVLWFISPAEMLKQIAAILIIGLLLDIPNTWIQNVGILRWYLERKHGAEA